MGLDEYSNTLSSASLLSTARSFNVSPAIVQFGATYAFSVLVAKILRASKFYLSKKGASLFESFNSIGNVTRINEQTLLKRNLNVARIMFLPCEQNVVGKLPRTTKSFSQLLQREQNFRASSSRAALFVQTYRRRLMSRLIAGLSVVPEMATRGRGRPAPARKAPAFWRGSRQGRAERRRTLWPAWCKRPGIHRRYASKHFDIVGGIAAASSVRRIIRLNYLPVRSMSDVRHLLFNTAEASHEAAPSAHLRFYFVRH